MEAIYDVKGMFDWAFWEFLDFSFVTFEKPKSFRKPKARSFSNWAFGLLTRGSFLAFEGPKAPRKLKQIGPKSLFDGTLRAIYIYMTLRVYLAEPLE